MLKNAILDAKICGDFAKIWQFFDKISLKSCQNHSQSPDSSRRLATSGTVAFTPPSALRKVCALFASFSSSNPSSTPSLFPRLVLGWINADFRVQIRILQHFSKSTIKSSSRKQLCQFFFNPEFCKKTWEVFGIFQKINFKICKILQNFSPNFKNFVDSEKCWKMLYWMQKSVEILLKSDNFLTKFH